MTAGAPDPSSIVLDSKTYQLAEGPNGRYAHNIISAGKDLVWRRDFRSGSLGMGETSEQTETGYFFSDNMDCTSRGLRLSPTVNVITANVGWLTGDYGYWFEEADATGVNYLYLTTHQSATVIRTHKITLGATPAVIAGASQPFDETVTAGNGPGRPERFEGFWYRAEGGNTPTTRAIQRLATVNTGTGADTWTQHDTPTSVQMLLREQQSSGMNRMLRDTVTNKISLVSSNPLVEANWAPSPGYAVGEGATTNAVVLDGASHAGMTLLAKPDGLFAFDPAGNSYNLLEFLQKAGVTATDVFLGSGRGTLSFGEIVLYPHQTGLYLVQSMRVIKRVGPDAISYYTAAPNITEPRKFLHREITAFSHWIWYPYTTPSGSLSYMIANQAKNHPNGLPFYMHTIIKRSGQMRSPYIDHFSQRLWWGEPPNQIAWIQLGSDGSPDGASRGNTSSSYSWHGPELNARSFGVDSPEVTMQFRYIFLEIEGGVSNCSWQAAVYRDGGTAVNVGSAVTATADITWPLTSSAEFTASLARRLRLRISAATDGTFTPGSADPKVLTAAIYARTPDTVEVTLTTHTEGDTKSLFEMEKILRKLKDRGPVTIREPNTNETFTGYIKAVNNSRRNALAGTVEGVQLLYERWSTQF